MKEDYKRIAEELGEEPPKEKSEDKQVEPKAENPVEVPKEEPKPAEKPKKSVDSIKIANGFSFGLMAALGFWIVTVIIAGITYLVLTLSGLF